MRESNVLRYFCRMSKNLRALFIKYKGSRFLSACTTSRPGSCNGKVTALPACNDTSCVKGRIPERGE